MVYNLMSSLVSDIVMAISLVTASHSLGHVNAGDKKGYRVQVNPSTFSEDIYPKIRRNGETTVKLMPNRVDRSYIEGGGFAGQDEIAGAMGKKTRLVNSIYKFGYLAAIPDAINKEPGDFRRMEQYGGKSAKHVMQAAIAISAISDMLKAFDMGLPDNQDLRFWTSDTGAPGLQYTRRF